MQIDYDKLSPNDLYARLFQDSVERDKDLTHCAVLMPMLLEFLQKNTNTDPIAKAVRDHKKLLKRFVEIHEAEGTDAAQKAIRAWYDSILDRILALPLAQHKVTLEELVPLMAEYFSMLYRLYPRNSEGAFVRTAEAGL